MLLRRNPCDGNKFQVKVPDEGVDFRPVLGGDVLHHLLHDGIVGIQLFRWWDRLFWCDFGFAMECPADDDVGYVGTHCSVLVGCLVNQVVGYLNVEVGAFPYLLDPGIISIDIRECDYLPASEDFHLVAKLGLAARGHPYELGHHTGTDDGRLLCLDRL